MKSGHRHGFTLLEVLMTVSLLTIITASIMGGVHLGRRSWEASRISDTLDEVENAVRMTTELVGKSFIVMSDQTTKGLQNTPLTFFGAPNNCRLIALNQGGTEWGGLIVTEIGVENGPEGVSLVVWTKPYHPKTGLSVDRESMKKTILTERLVSIQFGYFGAQESSQGPAQALSPTWNDNWASASTLPELVSVTIVLRRLGQEIKRSAVVALRQQ